MRGKGSTIVTIAITVFLVLAVLSPIYHSASDVEENMGTPAGWTDDIRLTNTADHIQDKIPVIEANGNNIHLVWEHDVTAVGPGGHYDIYYINSTNSGQNWNNPVPLSDGSLDIYYRHPDMTVSDNNVNIVWDSINFGRIVYRNSSDGGTSWSDTKNISIDDGWHSDYPKIAVNASELHVVWVDQKHREESMPWNTELYYVRSLDGGITWDDGLGNVGQERRLTNALYESFGGQYGLCVEDDTIHLVWGDARNGISMGEIYYKRSLDKGVTWDDGLGNIDQDRVLTSNLTSNHGLSAVAVNGTTIHVAWVDQMLPNCYIYYRNSTDNGASWNPIRLLVNSGTVAYAPSIDVEENEVHVVWPDRRDNGIKDEVYYKNSTNNGVTWCNDVRLTDIVGNGSYWPIIDVDDSTIHVTWTNYQFPIIEWDDNREIYYKRYPDFPPDPEFNISLQEGWNLISLPLEQSNESIDQVLSSIDGKWDYIQTYDAINGLWQSNATFKPDQLNDFSTLNHKVGFWINITEPSLTLTVRGYIPASTSINLYAGWNLVGYPSVNTETVANALWGTGANRVEVFDPGEPYRIREVGPTYVMKPGEGYWVHVPINTVWIVDW